MLSLPMILTSPAGNGKAFEDLLTMLVWCRNFLLIGSTTFVAALGTFDKFRYFRCLGAHTP